jgi:hypothetical protein
LLSSLLYILTVNFDKVHDKLLHHLEEAAEVEIAAVAVAVAVAAVADRTVDLQGTDVVQDRSPAEAVVEKVVEGGSRIHMVDQEAAAGWLLIRHQGPGSLEHLDEGEDLSVQNLALPHDHLHEKPAVAESDELVVIASGADVPLIELADAGARHENSAGLELGAVEIGTLVVVPFGEAGAVGADAAKVDAEEVGVVAVVVVQHVVVEYVAAEHAVVEHVVEEHVVAEHVVVEHVVEEHAVVARVVVEHVLEEPEAVEAGAVQTGLVEHAVVEFGVVVADAEQVGFVEYAEVGFGAVEADVEEVADPSAFVSAFASDFVEMVAAACSGLATCHWNRFVVAIEEAVYVVALYDEEALMNFECIEG